MRPAAEPGRGDLVVVNTCTLTARADRDALKFIRRTAAATRGRASSSPAALAERAADELARMPGVWRIIPNAGKEGLAEAALAGWPRDRDGGAAVRPRARAFLKIQDGCDRACAYLHHSFASAAGAAASLPSAIGTPWPGWRPAGYREVVLSGIHLGSYGRDLEPRTSLAGLLAGLEARDEGPWLRLSSLDPRLVTADFLAALASHRRLRPHFHLSLQHGSDAVLAAMGRAPAAADNEALLGRFAAAFPEAAIGADILVGFPGETADDFQQTVDMVERSPLTYVHVFAFSPRPGTPAAAMPQVDGAVRKQRAVRLRAVSRRKSAAFRSRFLGRVLDGIVIKAGPDGAEVLTGNAIEVEASGRIPARGEDVRVRITAARRRAGPGGDRHMNRIARLPEEVARKIAAGEVIERPVSVVKELVENSLDAGAREIAVELLAGGKALLSVRDDGHGMSRHDAELCFERHSTSKIAREEDLEAIATLGFRGEALASIAAVSRLTLKTSEGGAEAGTKIEREGGGMPVVSSLAFPRGTTIEVRELFFNLPARRKFLRATRPSWDTSSSI